MRASGHEEESVAVEFEEGLSIFMDFRLRVRSTLLSEVRVSAGPSAPAPGLRGFEERRRIGVGRFLDRVSIGRWENRRTGDMLRSVPGIDVKSRGSRAWVSSGRAVGQGQGALTRTATADVLDRADIAAGASLACYMDVYVDGAMVYNSSSLLARTKEPLYDVNTIPPASIEAIEVFVGPSQVPAEFNKTSAGCGVVLIWTRSSED